jgi:hypothetical protein
MIDERRIGKAPEGSSDVLIEVLSQDLTEGIE